MFKHLYHLGTHRLPDRDRPRVRVINLLALIALGMTFVYMFLYGVVFSSWQAAGLNLLFTLGYAGYFPLVHRGRLHNSRLWLVGVYITQMTVLSLWVIPAQSGVHLYVIVGVPLLFLVFDHRERVLRTTFALALIAIFWLAEWLDTPKLLAHLSPEFLRASYLAAVPLICLLIAVALQAFVDELRLRDDALQHLSVTDQLTNVANRRGLFEQAEGMRSQAVRHALPLCVLMLDIDHFKTVNDVHGHAAGDRLLAEVAATLRNTMRKEDAVGRVGGEEFALVLTNTALAQGLVVAETLRQRVSDVRVLTDKGQPIACTASLGVTALAATDTHFSLAMARADKALYQAKTEGRNRVSSL